MASPMKSMRSARRKWAARKKKVDNGVGRIRRVRGAAGRATNWAFGDYVCTACQPATIVRERDRKAHVKFHEAELMVVGKTVQRENQVAARERAARRRSQTVQQERNRRGTPTPPPQQEQGTRGAVPPPQPEPARDRARRTWADQVDTRRRVMAGEQEPANQRQRVAATGPAGYIQAAARQLIDFTPLDHGEQKELALSMNAAMGDLARAVEAYQENRVRERFHPNCIRPLDLVTSAIMECRAGWVHMLLAIERHYAAHFEAARQGGPVPGQQQGSSYFNEAAAG